jgi:hypothetical protein
MSFRVAVIGGRSPIRYGTLRATLDTLLANRLPDVELLTAGGPGVSMLAASYAAERGLSCAALVPEFGRYPEAAAVARRDAELVAMADAAVVVLTGREPGVRRLLELLRASGKPVHIVGAEGVAKVKAVKRTEAEPERRGLPD